MELQTITTGSLHNDTYILTNNYKECIIIDASAPLEDVISATNGFKVLGIILTHGHYDHIQFLDEIMSYFKINGFIHKNEIEKLYKPELNYSRVFNAIKVCDEPREHFKLLNDREEFKIGHFNIKTFLTKGHTNGSICIEVDDKFFTGDTLLHWSCGRTDLLTGSEEDMQESLKWIRENYAGREYYSGHGKKGIV